MAYDRPALTTLIERSITDVESRLPDVGARLRRSFINAVVRAFAGVAHGLYSYIQYLSNQLIADSAETEFLDRHASWWGIVRNGAVSAAGLIDFTGTGIIPAGTILQRSDGVQFTTNIEAVLTGSGSVAVTAIDAGAAGNTAGLVAVTLVSAIAGINSDATVNSAGLTGGADIETDDGLRQRLRERVQQTPHGGAKHDYIAWAKEIAGVTRVWVFPQWLGDGTVGVFFVRDNDVDIIPDAAEVSAVQTHVDNERPVTAIVSVIAPVAAVQNMTIALNPNDTATQAAVQAELSDLFVRDAAVDDGDGSGTILISRIREAVSITAGESDNAVLSPAANITLSAGQIATLGAITWQAL